MRWGVWGGRVGGEWSGGLGCVEWMCKGVLSKEVVGVWVGVWGWVRGPSWVLVWTVRGPCVDHAWSVRGVRTARGLCVDRAWTLRGPCVDLAWTVRGPCGPCGPRVHFAWTVRGPCLDRAWTLRGPCVDPVRRHISASTRQAGSTYAGFCL